MSPRKPKESRRENDRLPPLKMPDVSPEDALRGFMQVDPEKVKKAEKKRKKKRDDDEETQE